MAGASGTDTFTFQAFDGIDYSNIATIAVTIANVPSPQDQIVAILWFFDSSALSGALVGVPDKGKGKSAKQQSMRCATCSLRRAIGFNNSHRHRRANN